MKHAFSFMHGETYAALCLAAFTGLSSSAVHAQTAVQNFDGLNINSPTELGYDGSPSLVSGTATASQTLSGSNLFITGNRAWGIRNATETVLFRTRYTEIGSAANYIQFRLGAWGTVPNSGNGQVDGLDVDDKVEVWVSINSAEAVRAITITGRASNANQAYWDYSGTGRQEVTYDQQATVTPNGNNIPTDLSTIRINLPEGKQSIRFYIIAANNSAGELWTIDQVTIGSNRPLPVELKSFTAAASAKGTQLHWATASEKNNAAFEIQRGSTAEQFQTIGRVSGQGTSSQGHSYSWVDKQPLPGLSYYRLRQVDYDSTESFSPVAVVQQPTDLPATSFFPNPSTGFVTLAPALGDVEYRVINALGQSVLTGKATGGSIVNMQLLRAGSYFLELHSATGRTIERFLRE